MRLRTLALTTGLVAVLLLALPAAGGEDVIVGGIDLWQTPADGTTYADFVEDPIPAGFFCPGSAAFSSKIFFGGAPIATGRRGTLGAADTIIVRLDDARFDSTGVASTRVQVKALSLVGVEPIQTSCGAFRVSAALLGTQPVTTMRIVRDHRAGGHFEAPLGLRVKLAFTSVGGERRELLNVINFDHQPTAWSSRPGKGGLEVAGSVLVDTDGDGRTDTRLPGTSNFFPGWASEPDGSAAVAQPGCHCDSSQTFLPQGAGGGAPQLSSCVHWHCPYAVVAD